MKWKWKCSLLSRVRLFVTAWTVAHQAPLSMGFSRPEYWSGLPFPSPGDLPNPGIEPVSCIAGRFFIIWATNQDMILKTHCRIQAFTRDGSRWSALQASLSLFNRNRWYSNFHHVHYFSKCFHVYNGFILIQLHKVGMRSITRPTSTLP